METRIEKRKRLKKENRKKFCKFIIIAFTLFILCFGIKIINENIVYLDYVENPNIFRFNISESRLDLFGKSYFIDLKIFKKTD